MQHSLFIIYWCIIEELKVISNAGHKHVSKWKMEGRLDHLGKITDCVTAWSGELQRCFTSSAKKINAVGKCVCCLDEIGQDKIG